MAPSAVQSRIAAYEAQARRDNGELAPTDLHDWVLDGMPPSPLTPPSSPPKPPALQVKNRETSFLYPTLGGMGVKAGENGRHVSGSSVSSLHSVSLSSDTEPIDRVPTGSSLTESFEEISIHQLPPPLPQRPTTVPPPLTSPPAHQPHTPLPYVPRRAPPPPPATSRASDRSSIYSSASATSSSVSRRSSSSAALQTPTFSATLPLPPPSSPNSLSAAALAKTKRPTPVPAAARKRYLSVFTANIVQRRRAEAEAKANSALANKPKKLSHAEAKRTRQAAGWRGLSVDLITATPEELLAHENEKGKQRLETVDQNVGSHDRLEGGIVKAIWSRSRIDKSKLAEIWSECDSESKGSLDVDSFVRGMWRIDEHLRRTQAQTSALRNANSTSLTTLRSGIGSLKIKSGGGLQRSTSRSSLGTSISRSSSVNSSSRHRLSPANTYPPPPPVPKIVLQ